MRYDPLPWLLNLLILNWQVKGVELELTVPDGCQPGELIYVDVPREGQNQRYLKNLKLMLDIPRALYHVPKQLP